MFLSHMLIDESPIIQSEIFHAIPTNMRLAGIARHVVTPIRFLDICFASWTRMNPEVSHEFPILHIVRVFGFPHLSAWHPLMPYDFTWGADFRKALRALNCCFCNGSNPIHLRAIGCRTVLELCGIYRGILNFAVDVSATLDCRMIVWLNSQRVPFRQKPLW
jgi:hypothetical protein